MKRAMIALITLTLLGCPGGNPLGGNSEGNIRGGGKGTRVTVKPSAVPTGKRTLTPGGGEGPCDDCTVGSLRDGSPAPGTSLAPGQSPAPGTSLAPGQSPGPGVTPDPNRASSDPLSGDMTFGFVSETAGTWSIRNFLNRPRAGAGVGVVASATGGFTIIASEGEHRPSMEVWDPTKGNGWVLSTAHDADLNTDGGENTLQQGLYLTTAGVFNDELWTAGGYRGQFNVDGSSGRVNLYMYTKTGFGLGRSDEGPYNLKAPRRAAVGGIVNGTFVIAGGMFNNTAIVPTTELIDMKKAPEDSKPGAAMPLPVAGGASAVDTGKLYVMGGYTLDSQGRPTAVDSVQVYTAASNSWSKDGAGGAPPVLPVALHSAGATATNGLVYVAGGLDASGGVLDRVFVLDTLKTPLAWKELSGMPTPRALLGMVPFQNAIWAIGGIGSDKRPLRTVETYNPPPEVSGL